MNDKFKFLSKIFVFAVALSASAASHAWYGGGWRGDGWHHGGWRGPGWNGWGNRVVVGVPVRGYGYNNYYARRSCYTQCNRYGRHCVRYCN